MERSQSIFIWWLNFMAKFKTLNKKEKREIIASKIIEEVVYNAEEFQRKRKTDEYFEKFDKIITIIKKYV